MYEALPNWTTWAVGAAGVLVVLASLWPQIKEWLASRQPVPSPATVGPDPIAAFTCLKACCKDCPAACEALKVVWSHLEPGHVEAKPNLAAPRGTYDH